MTASATEIAPFANEPVLELRRGSVRSQLADALERADRALPLTVPVMIGDGERAEEASVSTDPGEPERVIAHVAGASENDVEAAVNEAVRGFGYRMGSGR